MITQLFLQIAIASAAPLAKSAVPLPQKPLTERIVPGPNDKNALDILNNTRPDVLQRGAQLRCPAVKTLYVDGKTRQASEIDRGFSTATLYLAGDTVMVMVPPSVADALRTVPAASVRTVQYADCTTKGDGVEPNTLYITTK